jgi:hypothetical protein
MDFNNNNERMLLINILNTMYSDNSRQINNLTNSNNQIRSLIFRLLSNQNRRRTHNNSSNSQNHSNINYIPNNTFQNTTPLVFDFILPQSELNMWTSNTQQNSALSRLLQRFFEPIEIYPTPSQIEAATRITRYGDIVSPRNRSCPISLENFNENDTVSVIRFCGHVFNTEQLNIWFGTNCRCPVCRYDIRNYNSNNNSADLQQNEEPNNSAPPVNNSPPPANNSPLPANNSPLPANNSPLPANNSPLPVNNRGRNSNLNNLYYTLLSSGSDSLINFLTDPSGNNSEFSSNTFLDNYQRRLFR